MLDHPVLLPASIIYGMDTVQGPYYVYTYRYTSMRHRQNNKSPSDIEAAVLILCQMISGFQIQEFLHKFLYEI